MRRSIEKSRIVKDNIIASYIADGYTLKSVTERRNKFIIQMENKKHYIIMDVYKYEAKHTTTVY